MPPGGMPAPRPRHAGRFCGQVGSWRWISAAAANPNPGTTGLHRLNRTEYANAIRDLLDLEIDPTTLLPADDSSEGFDNIADALAISPALLERYVATATKVSRLAVGDPGTTPSTATYRVPSDLIAEPITSKACRWARAAAFWCATFSRWMPSTPSRFMPRPRTSGSARRAFCGEELEVTLNGERVKVAKAAPTAGSAPPDQGRAAGAGRRVHSQESSGRRRYLADLSRAIPASRASRSPGRFNPTGLWRHAQPAAHFRLPAAVGDRGRRAGCAKKILSTLGAARLPAAALATRIWKRCWAFIETGRQATRVSMPASSRRWPACWSIRASCSVSSASRRMFPPAPFIASAIWNSPRAFRFSCGAASPTTNCWIWRCRTNCTSPPCWNAQTRRMLADPALGDAGHQLRRPVAVSARVEESAPALARVQRQSAPGFPPRNGVAV